MKNSIKTIQIKLNISGRKKRLIEKLRRDTKESLNYVIKIIIEKSKKGDLYPSKYPPMKLFVYEGAPYPLKKFVGLKGIFLESIVIKAYSAYKANKQSKPNITFNPCTTFRTRVVKIIKSKRGNYMLKMSHPYEYRKAVILPLKGHRYDEELKYIVDERKNEFPCEIVKRGNDFFAHIGVKKVKREQKISKHFTPVGVDRGITNLAVATALDNGKIIKPKFWSGEEYNHKHRIFVKRLRSLMKGKKLTAVRRTKGKMRRYTNAILHNISRELINYAKHFPNPVIILENLKGIKNERTIYRKDGKTPKKNKYAKKINRTLNRWSYNKLRGFVEYKASENSIPIVYTEPRGTSSTCPKCSEKIKRDYDIHLSSCTNSECGYKLNDDLLGAYNIALQGMEVINKNNTL